MTTWSIPRSAAASIQRKIQVRHLPDKWRWGGRVWLDPRGGLWSGLSDTSGTRKEGILSSLAAILWLCPFPRTRVHCHQTPHTLWGQTLLFPTNVPVTSSAVLRKLGASSNSVLKECMTSDYWGQPLVTWCVDDHNSPNWRIYFSSRPPLAPNTLSPARSFWYALLFTPRPRLTASVALRSTAGPLPPPAHRPLLKAPSSPQPRWPFPFSWSYWAVACFGALVSLSQFVLTPT